MRRKTGIIQRTFFATAVLASLGFGTSQALARPANPDPCGGHAFWVYCPAPRDCSEECYANGYPHGGFCHDNCCTCAY